MSLGGWLFFPWSATGSITSTPGAASLVVTGFAPRLARTAAVGAASLAITGFAPRLTITVKPGAANVVVTGFAPSVTVTANVRSSPGVGALVVSGFAPALSAAVKPGAAGIILTGFAPALTETVPIAPAGMVITGFAPTVTVGGGNVVVALDGAGLVIAGFAPTVLGISSPDVIDTHDGGTPEHYRYWRRLKQAEDEKRRKRELAELETTATEIDDGISVAPALAGTIPTAEPVDLGPALTELDRIKATVADLEREANAIAKRRRDEEILLLLL
jgi:hypothetical protein